MQSTTIRTKRKPNSAVQGGIFLTRGDLALRWGLSEHTIVRKEKAGLLHPVKLSDQIVRYYLSDVQRIEAEGRTAK